MSDHIARLRAFKFYFDKGSAVASDELRDAMKLLDDYDALATENERLRSAIERAGKCLAMSNNGAAEALRILRETKIADQPSVCDECGGTGLVTLRGVMVGGIEGDADDQPCPFCTTTKE